MTTKNENTNKEEAKAGFFSWKTAKAAGKYTAYAAAGVAVGAVAFMAVRALKGTPVAAAAEVAAETATEVATEAAAALWKAL